MKQLKQLLTWFPAIGLPAGSWFVLAPETFIERLIALFACVVVFLAVMWATRNFVEKE